MDLHGVLRSISVHTPTCLALSLLWLAGCAGTIPPRELDRMSERSYTALLEDASRRGVLNADEGLTGRVRAVASRIIPQTGTFRSDAPDWRWEVNVIDGSEVNAFCMPGGRIIFYSGLVRGLALTDDEIAVLMAHDVAHALRGHSRGQVSRPVAAQGASDKPTPYRTLLATEFSRADEAEADSVGLELAARAGYDPRAGVSLWQKMVLADQEEQQRPEFLGTHPADASRVQQIQALLPKVTPLYQQAQARK